MKAYVEKAVQLEKEITRKTYDYNTMLERVEAVEKANLVTSKDRERRHGEEKTALIKKVEALGQEVQRLKDGIE